MSENINNLLSPLPEIHPVEKLESRAIREINYLKEYLLGRTLTVIDASVSDPIQRKAQKDVIKEAFYSKEYFTDNVLTVFADYLRSLEELDEESQRFADSHIGYSGSSNCSN